MCLAAGIKCQLLPTEAQVVCLENYLNNDPFSSDAEDVTANCNGLDLFNEPLSACSRQSCVNSLARIFRRCGFDVEAGEFRRIE